MEFTKNKCFQLTIGIASFVMLILSLFMLAELIPHDLGSWSLAILVICSCINIVEVIVYFLLIKNEIQKLTCKWLNIFSGIVMLVAICADFIANAEYIFQDISKVAGWFTLVYVLLNLAIISFMITYLVYSKEKQIKEEKMEAAQEPVKEEKAEEKAQEPVAEVPAEEEKPAKKPAAKKAAASKPKTETKQTVKKTTKPAAEKAAKPAAKPTAKKTSAKTTQKPKK